MAKSSIYTRSLAVLMVLSPFPFGFRLAELSILAIIGLIILISIRAIGLTQYRLIIGLVGMIALGTLSQLTAGAEFSEFQAFRLAIFVVILVWLCREDIAASTFETIEFLLPVVCVCVGVSLFIYFVLGSDYYNSTLDIPYEEALYKRLFVYPVFFFAMLFVDASNNHRVSQYFYLLILFASGSKALIITAMIVYLINAAAGLAPRRVAMAFVTIGFAVLFIYVTDIVQRIEDFFFYGDPWRIEEPLAALEHLSNPRVFLLGNGTGLPYWEGRTALVQYDEIERGILNSAYDVHNGVITLMLRFGVLIGLWALYLILKACPGANWRERILFQFVVLSNIILSHGPIQTVEAVGLIVALRLIDWRVSERLTTENARSGGVDFAH